MPHSCSSFALPFHRYDLFTTYNEQLTLLDSTRRPLLAVPVYLHVTTVGSHSAVFQYFHVFYFVNFGFRKWRLGLLYRIREMTMYTFLYLSGIPERNFSLFLNFLAAYRYANDSCYLISWRKYETCIEFVEHSRISIIFLIEIAGGLISLFLACTCAIATYNRARRPTVNIPLFPCASLRKM